MSEELEQLREDLERLEEYGRMMIETNEKVLDKIRDRIRDLEAVSERHPQEPASNWLRELGAVRPMAPAGEEVLVLGEWHDGFYPIMWQSVRLREGVRTDHWFIFGVETHWAMSRDECVRILNATRGAK